MLRGTDRARRELSPTDNAKTTRTAPPAVGNLPDGSGAGFDRGAASGTARPGARGPFASPRSVRPVI